MLCYLDKPSRRDLKRAQARKIKTVAGEQLGELAKYIAEWSQIA